MFLLAASVIMSSCNEEDDDNNNAGNGSMNLKHDGTSWTANIAVQGVNTNGVLSVTGSDGSANQCNITLYNIPGTGTYQLGGTMTNTNSGRWTQGLGTNDTYSTMLGQGTGTCVITELTASKVEGTFEFTARNTLGALVTITEGSFSANLAK